MNSNSITTPYTSTKLYAWSIAFLSIFINICNSMALNSMTPIMKTLLLEFGLPTTYGGSFVSLFVLINFCLAIPIGIFISKRGIRLTGISGLSILTVGLVLGVFTKDPVVLLFTRIIQGIGYTSCLVIGPMMIISLFPKEKSSLPLGIYMSGTGVGQMIIFSSSTFLIQAGGWRMVWLFAAFATILCLILFIFSTKPEQFINSTKHESKRSYRLSDAAKIPAVWMLGIIYFCFSIGVKGFTPFQNMIYTSQAGVTDAIANTLSTIGAFGMILAGVFAGFVMNNFKNHRGKIFIFIVSVGMFMFAYGYRLNSELQVWIFACTFGWLACAITPSCLILLPQKVPAPLVAVSLSIILTIGRFLGGICGPMVSSISQTIGGSWIHASYPTMLLGIVSIICAFYIGLPLDKKIYTKEHQKPIISIEFAK